MDDQGKDYDDLYYDADSDDAEWFESGEEDQEGGGCCLLIFFLAGLAFLAFLAQLSYCAGGEL